MCAPVRRLPGYTCWRTAASSPSETQRGGRRDARARVLVCNVCHGYKPVSRRCAVTWLPSRTSAAVGIGDHGPPATWRQGAPPFFVAHDRAHNPCRGRRVSPPPTPPPSGAHETPRRARRCAPACRWKFTWGPFFLFFFFFLTKRW